jgi:TrmH family RNA methyltransferase
VKAAVGLRDRRDRERTGLTVVDGAREIGRALAASVEVTALYICEAQATGADARAAIEAAGRAGVELVRVNDRVMERLAFGERADGVVAVVRPPVHRLDDLTLPPEPLVAVIEGVEKPGNLGAILRSADGAGLDAVIAADPRTDLFNPNAIRASLGTIFAVPIAAADSAAIRAWADVRGLRMVAARVDGTVEFGEVDLTGPVAIVLGSEAAGLTNSWAGDGVIGVRLPMRGIADSLNVAATAAVLFYEALRQRRSGPS